MIPVSSSTLDSNKAISSVPVDTDWQTQMAKSFRTPKDLLHYLNIDEKKLPYKVDHDNAFRLRVSQHFADLINPSDAFDPILLQVLPRIEEMQVADQYGANPLHENDFSPVPGLIHKYANRVLLITHQACAVHCRYCFRRHFPYQNQRVTDDTLKQSINYIASNPAIEEVILSGGDPLSLNDEQLGSLLERLDRISQIRTIRLHSRTPTIIPARITESLLAKLRTLSKKIVLVLHINHTNEISDSLRQQLRRLRACNVHLLNQAVLLHQINDSADTQVRLCQTLFDLDVLPYYLHCLDPVQGAHHFEVDEARAQSIWQEMQSKLSGYLLPRLVREIPYKTSKTWINNANDTERY
ncbi:EF-P beta-lysylation protein EpmB [Reinekea sp. G2M2-21]|uniref:EF-P beta-lysylation protein EpmB n=1 Tax=Reinekea sp. G2M2-21 TaxID=2788942 RepID=UPI0018A88EB9|nr:EF-P beta-lysylation protein EpmB [Reinekea sp. G2M2-21]